MDVAITFRNLATGQYMPGFDYVHTKFSFQTLFYKSAYSYCCCTCAVEHEYLEYIKDNGVVDEELYKKVLQSILDGKCPHVDGKSLKYISETTVTGMQIAAVVGTQAIEENENQTDNAITGIFKLQAYEIAIMKGHYQCIDIFGDSGEPRFLTSRIKLPFLKHLEQNKNQIKIELISILELLIQAGIITDFERFLECCGFLRSMDVANLFRYNISEFRDALIQHHMKSTWFYYSSAEPIQFGDLAIMYDQPQILNAILTHVPKSNTDIKNECLERFHETCSLLKRKDCEQVLYKHKFQRTDVITESEQIRRLLFLLGDYYDDFKEEILGIFKKNGTDCGAINILVPRTLEQSELRPYLHVYIENHLENLNIEVIKTLFDLGTDVHAESFRFTPKVTPKGDTTLLKLLSRKPAYDGNQLSYRKTLEIVLSENPYTDLNEAAVSLAIQYDMYLATYKQGIRPGDIRIRSDLAGIYIMDGKEHLLFGHDHDYHLNFVTSLLIEGGFSYTRDTLLEALEKPLHPVEYQYIQRCLDMPRSLKLKCRDVLRKHFGGRKIHSFVENSHVPKAIQDFILMKSELCNI